MQCTFIPFLPSNTSRVLFLCANKLIFPAPKKKKYTFFCNVVRGKL